MYLVRLVFLLLSLVTLGSALGVIFSRNILHSALFLILSFIGVAGIYILLEAPFLAVVQIFIYAGAIAVLIIFAIMLTRRLTGEGIRQMNEQRGVAAVAVVLLFAILAFILANTDWHISKGAPVEDAVGALGQGFLTTYVLPFEVAAVLLLAALVGAIVIAREE